MRLLKQKEERRMKKKCWLCKMEARTFCESDEASLCWKCDSKVHGANFLVARHARYLLCALCHSPTPWSASGPYLPPSLSLCHPCSLNAHHHVTHHPHQQQQQDEEEKNQVVPVSSDSPLTCSSSTTQEYETGACADDELEGVDTPSLKRPRHSSTNLCSFFILQKEKGRSELGRKRERSEADRRVEYRTSSGSVAKRFGRSSNREESDESSENVSRTT